MNALYWFSNDLRITGNFLFTKLEQESKSLHCCFIIEPHWFDSSSPLNSSMGIHRWDFLKQSLIELASALHDRNTTLQVFYGKPDNILPTLIDKLNIVKLGYANQVGYNEKKCLSALQSKLPSLTIEMTWLNTLFEEDFIDNNNAVVGSFSKFRKIAEKNLSTINIAPCNSGWQFSEKNHHNINANNNASLHTAIFTVDNLFFPQPHSTKKINERVIKGGCKSAAVHLKDYLLSGAADHYKQTRNDLHGLRRSTLFSPWLALGCISAKQIWQAITDYEQQNQANESTYWIKFELLWREYFQWLALKKGRQLFIFKGSAQTPFHLERFQQWSTGSTEYPLVNALMKQLNSTGFMSNRGRQIVASYLVNELQIDWRYGASYFEKQLIDYDVASNWGNWQYLAGVGEDPQKARWFNIEKQRQYYDRDGEFIAKWQGEQQTAYCSATKIQKISGKSDGY